MLEGVQIVLYRVNHIHIKSMDPKTTADWYVKAFNFKIVSDAVRSFGDRFIGREPAWHRLGQVFDRDEKMTATDAMNRADIIS